jgi:hypothetical protein
LKDGLEFRAAQKSAMSRRDTLGNEMKRRKEYLLLDETVVVQCTPVQNRGVGGISRRSVFLILLGVWR